MEQLTLMKDFDKSLRKEEALLDRLLDSIKDIKYLRSRLSFCGLSETEKTEVLSHINKALYWQAQLAFSMTRYHGKLRYEKLDYFKKLTEDTKLLGMEFYPTREEVKEHAIREYTRMASLFSYNTKEFGPYSSKCDKIKENLGRILPIL